MSFVINRSSYEKLNLRIHDKNTMVQFHLASFHITCAKTSNRPIIHQKWMRLIQPALNTLLVKLIVFLHFPHLTPIQPMMTLSNGKIFRVIGHLCGEFTGHRWIPLTKASDAEIDVFFDLCLNKRLSKQSWGWLFETPSRPLWRHFNESFPFPHLTPIEPVASHQFFIVSIQWAIHKTNTWKFRDKNL